MEPFKIQEKAKKEMVRISAWRLANGLYASIWDT